MGSAILWDVDTGLSTTDAHVILDCGTSNGMLDPETHGVALGVGSADADIVWLWTARIVNISYPPSNKPSWPAKKASWSFEIAPGSLDLAVLQVQGHLNGSPFADVQYLNQSFANRGLKAVPLGDSDSELAQVGSAVRVYGFGQSDSHRTQRAMMMGGMVSRKTDQTITIDAAILGGHSGGMLLDSAGEVIGWCVWSQTNNVFGDGSLSAPSGANDARPVNLLRPALEAALLIIDPSRTGVTLTEKLRGALPLRPVQDQAGTAAEAAGRAEQSAQDAHQSAQDAQQSEQGAHAHTLFAARNRDDAAGQAVAAAEHAAGAGLCASQASGAAASAELSAAQAAEAASTAVRQRSNS